MDCVQEPLITSSRDFMENKESDKKKKKMTRNELPESKDNNYDSTTEAQVYKKKKKKKKKKRRVCEDVQEIQKSKDFNFENEEDGVKVFQTEKEKKKKKRRNSTADEPMERVFQSKESDSSMNTTTSTITESVKKKKKKKIKNSSSSKTSTSVMSTEKLSNDSSEIKHQEKIKKKKKQKSLYNPNSEPLIEASPDTVQLFNNANENQVNDTLLLKTSSPIKTNISFTKSHFKSNEERKRKYSSSSQDSDMTSTSVMSTEKLSNDSSEIKYQEKVKKKQKSLYNPNSEPLIEASPDTVQLFNNPNENPVDATFLLKTSSPIKTTFVKSHDSGSVHDNSPISFTESQRLSVSEEDSEQNAFQTTSSVFKSNEERKRKYSSSSQDSDMPTERVFQSKESDSSKKKKKKKRKNSSGSETSTSVMSTENRIIRHSNDSSEIKHQHMSSTTLQHILDANETILQQEKMKKKQKSLYNPNSEPLIEPSPDTVQLFNNPNENPDSGSVLENSPISFTESQPLSVSEEDSKQNAFQATSSVFKSNEERKRKYSSSSQDSDMLNCSQSLENVKEKLLPENTGNIVDSSDDEFYDMLSKEAVSFVEDERNSKEDNGKKQKETELEISRTKLIYNGKSSDFKDPALLNWHKTGKDIQKDGIVFQKGFWTKYELDILNKNIENFKTAHAIEDFTKFFKRKKNESNFSIDNENIFEVLSENINRPLMNVRRKIESLVLETGNKSNTKYTEEEIAKLLKLAEKYPNNWQLIGANMKRSRKSVHAKFKAITEKSNHTKTNRFSSSEDDKIKEFVSESTNKNEINWKKLGNLLSRCPMSCKKRWLILSSGEERTSNKDTRKFYIEITKVLIEANISEPKDINWEMVLQKLGSNKNANIVKVKYRKWCDKHSDKLKGNSYCDKLKSLVHYI